MKLPSCVDMICRTSLGFSAGALKALFQGTRCENLMMYGGLYQHTQVVLYISYLEPYIS